MTALMKKLISLTLVALLCFSMVACSGLGEAGNGDKTDTETDDGTQPEAKAAASYVCVDINPSIELTVSDDNTVVSVYGANEDGKVLLYEEEANIVGKDVETAVDYVTKLAEELGYLTEENSDVTTTVAAKDAATAEALKAKIDAKIVSAAESIGLSVTVDAETAFSLLCELEELKALYPENTAINNLTPEKYKLVASAVNGGNVTVEAAAEMSNEALIAEIRKAHSTLEAYATEEYLEAKARATATFESSMGVLLDGIYTKIYTERAAAIFTNPAYINTIHYGATYQAYKTSARTYLAVLEIMSFADKYTSFELSPDDVTALATALGINDTTVLEDGDGKITLGSVTEFCEDFISENELSESVKAEVREILAHSKDAAELVAIASDTYATDLNALKIAIQGVITTVSTVSSTILPLLPADAKAEFQTCLDDLQATNASLADIIENGATDEQVIALAAEAQKKADAVLEKINADLSEDEKARAEALKAEVQTQIATLTADFNARLTAAETSAKQYIESERAKRLSEGAAE